MCGTCGCSSDGVLITSVKDGEHTHHHGHDNHSHGHVHQHDHESHSHVDKVIKIEQDILQVNDLNAARNRGYFEAKNITALNLVSSPGSGKNIRVLHRG